MSEKVVHDSNELCSELRDIIDNGRIKTLYQPIISLRDSSILGFEALSRGPEESCLFLPNDLFRVAGECNYLWDLELVCRTKALESAFRQKKDIKIFINVNPNVMHDSKFKDGFTEDFIKSYSKNPEDIVFELTERSAVDDIEGFKHTVMHYKNQSYHIAIDDAGAGYSGLNLISDIHPHFIKLDMQLIRGINKNGFKRALVKGMYEFSKTSNTLLIAEGIETEEELRVLINMGIQYGQGYLIQRPNEVINGIDEEIISLVKRINQSKNQFFANRLSNIYISNLVRDTLTVSPKEKAGNVHELFIRNQDVTGITIIDGQKAVGTITKSNLTLKLSGRYGYSLFANKEISYLMDRGFLTTEYDTPIDIVSHLAMSRPVDSLYDFIVINKEGQYLGVVTVKDLLEKTMEMEVINAKHQNPLSGLPGNMIIEKNLETYISSDKPYTILYLDIDNFKSYNDVYGFENGDNIIKLLANLLVESMSEEGFAGHIGGDDFVAIVPDYNALETCENIVSAFSESISKYYNENDLKRGFTVSKGRNGRIRNYPLISLSIAGVTNKVRDFSDIFILTEYIGTIKARCKQIEGNAIIIE